MKTAYVYILASDRNGTLYIGVTSDLIARVFKHKNHSYGDNSFSAKYNADKLVYYEESVDMLVAINREKRLKRYKREWKIRLIEEANPGWRDLSEDFI
jgi:putative endonuclease